MKKLLITLGLILVSCGTPQKEYTTNTIYNKNFTLQLVDSIMEAEGIYSVDSFAVKGRRGAYYEYYFLRDSLVFRFIKNLDSILVTKRINK